jgi:hypothetical protein
MQILTDSRLKYDTHEKALFATATGYIFVFISVHNGGSRSNIGMHIELARDLKSSASPT